MESPAKRARDSSRSARRSSASHSSPLGIGDARSTRSTRRPRKDMVTAPKFEVDPMWPKPLPNHWCWARRSASASMRRITSGSSIGRSSLAAEAAADQKPPIGELLPPGAAGPRVRPGRQLCCGRWGGPGDGLRLAGVESRPLDRSQGQRLDRRQRRHRRAHPEVHAGRQVHRAVRQAAARTRAATTPRTSAASRRSSSIRKRTRPTSPMATATSASP